PRDLRVEMGVDVDEAGRDELAARVDHLGRRKLIVASDADDAAIRHRDVGLEAWATAAIDDEAATDDQVGTHGPTLYARGEPARNRPRVVGATLTWRPSVAYRMRVMDLLVDADGHVLEPPDMWARYVDPAWRPRAIRVCRGDDGRDRLEIDGHPARLTTPEMLGGLGGMGRSLEELAAATLSGRYAEHAPAAAVDPGARLAPLDREELTHPVVYPTLGLQWEAEAPDAAYALAHARAYNRWIE